MFPIPANPILAQAEARPYHFKTYAFVHNAYVLLLENKAALYYIQPVRVFTFDKLVRKAARKYGNRRSNFGSIQFFVSFCLPIQSSERLFTQPCRCGHLCLVLDG